MTDGEGIIRLVGFDKHKRQELQSFCEHNTPVTLHDCHVQQNKFKNTLEIILKKHTKIEASQLKFDVPDLKTAGSSIIRLSQLPDIPENERVTIRVSVHRVNAPQTVGSNKTKQDVIVADETAKATVVLWGTDVETLKQGKSFQLNRLEVRKYLGKRQLSFPSVTSVDEISDIENLIELNTSSDDDDDEHLQSVTISGVKYLEKVYTCINCTKSVVPTNEHIGVCDSCNTAQKLSDPKQTAKLFIQCGPRKITLRAHDDTLKDRTLRSVRKKSLHKIFFSHPNLTVSTINFIQ